MAVEVGSAVAGMGRLELGRALVVTPALGLASSLDSRLAGVAPWRVVAGTAGASLALCYLYSLTQGRLPLTERIKKNVFFWIKKIPQVKQKLDSEMEKMKTGFETVHFSATEGLANLHSLPAKGLSKDAIIAATKEHLTKGDLDWKGGAMSGTLYNNSAELGALMTEVYGMAAWTNPLHVDAFPGLRKMEAEVVRMACSLFHGSLSSCGCVSSGGTESIILACKAYRDLAREERGVERGEMLVPITAHAAFDKAADMLGLRLRHIPVDPVTKRVQVAVMRSMITSSTIMLVGSAPQYPHGCIDDIEAIAALGVRYGIPVHVDACLGGFLIAFMEDAGFPVAPFDFRLEGVTSISADTHKYGFAPKGSSVILYRDKKYRDFQWFCFPDWPGGIYATPTIGGSRPGGIVASCWAALRYFGREGYVESTRDILLTTRKVVAAVRATPGLAIVGCPDVSVVAFASEGFNVYDLNDAMKERGWGLNALQFPSCVHICVTRPHTLPGVAERLIKDLQEATAELMANPGDTLSEGAAMYGMAASIPDRSVVSSLTGVYLDSLYSLGPGAGAGSNGVMPKEQVQGS